MKRRMAVFFCFALLVGVVFGGSGAAGQAAPDDPDAAVEAAGGVMEQLEESDELMEMAEIEGLDDLGPMPWLSFGRDRDKSVVEAWVEVATQLPAGELSANHRRPVRELHFSEREKPDQTGRNDTPQTGEPIRRFGTGQRDARRVTISGNLSGAEIRPPIEFDCPSIEDDGSITQANAASPFVPIGAFCGGEIGDGPFGDTTGDVDYFSFGEVEAGSLLVLDVDHVAGSLLPVEAVVGIYDAAGTLLASAEDAGDPIQPETLFLEVEEGGVYYGAIAGCCELASDPFDSASGLGVGQLGTYELFVVAIPPPCLSLEDDGAIGSANSTNIDLTVIDFCAGLIGDGPFGDTSGDADFYELGAAQPGDLAIVDVIDFGSPEPVATVTGLYDGQGNLLASIEDSGDPNAVEEAIVYEVEAAGDLYAAVVGCCELTGDPFDSSSGTGVAETGTYDVLVGLLPVIDDGGVGWRERLQAASDGYAELSSSGGERQRSRALAVLEARQAAVAVEVDEAPVVDTDVFLVYLNKGDAISGGFDDARVTGIIDPSGVVRMASQFNPSFLYPATSPLRHDRRTGFDHVVAERGVHAVVVSEGIGAYEGELNVTRSGLADEYSRGVQTIFLDFDGAEVSPSIFPGPPGDPVPAQALSPLSSFLADWGLGPEDEDGVIDGVIDAMIENLDTDLRVLDGRDGNRGRRHRSRFDIEILNSRDHPGAWGQPNVSRIVIGGTVDELQIFTIGIAQSIDPGNTDTEETGVVLLDLMSAPPGDVDSLNSYGVAPGRTMVEFVGHSVGHIAAHEVGHFIGNWHTDTFNGVVSIMDAGGEFESVYGVGADGVFGTDDDVDADFAEDIFNTFEGFSGLEDTMRRSFYALTPGLKRGFR